VHRFGLPTILLPALLLACAGDAPPPEVVDEAPQDQFWSNLQALCGQAYEGRLVQYNPGDSAFVGQRMVMHVRACGPDEIRIPFHVGEDRSRTWVITRTAAGLRLKHDHRHENGSEDRITQYGGDTAEPGTSEWQDFRADAFTAELIPAAATNVWTIEIIPGRSFTYALRREGTDRRFRAEFDLTAPVPAPPAPWGWSGPDGP
jgi:hypothetical protein